jgi:hypothetical protein
MEVEDWWGENSGEMGRMGLETEIRWGRMEVESWGMVVRDLRRPGRMGRGWEIQERLPLGRWGFQGKMGFQETGEFLEKMGKWRRLPSSVPERCCSGAHWMGLGEDLGVQAVVLALPGGLGCLQQPLWGQYLSSTGSPLAG